ncbi:CdaR family transcriptional regulator [Microbacterium sp. cx-59]|uniref:PucR family transcriptional regulator n=1 Tax=Microbacterium sp. cx-59 TaxID=2891207 RepID=UPI001E2FCC37|nr:helix-turn-helix domain-containing protein [Microbacterium sp. cx-59]MCC4908892.1 helix-turn-helix domain-containing protein [Microbacterium sp. cx-59]
MIAELLEHVEALANLLQRSVTVDDSDLRLLVYSTHFGDEDPLRIASLLNRRMPPPADEHFIRLGVRSWNDPRYVGASDAIGMSGRYGYPLRAQGELFGFMWVIDDGSMTELERAAVADTASRLTPILLRRQQRSMSELREREGLVLALVAGDRADRVSAVRDLNDQGVLVETSTVSVFVVKNTSRTDVQPDPEIIAAMRRALGHALATRLRSTYALAVGRAESVIVVSWSTMPQRENIEALAGQMAVELKRMLGRDAAHLVVGVGGPQNSALRSSVSYEQAVVAAREGAIRSSPVVLWADLGLTSIFAATVVDSLNPEVLPSLLRDLETTQTPETLRVIRVFLDNAGNVVKTAAALHMHRTTVYYRVAKFQESVGLDLEDGLTRLALHYWFTSRDYFNESPEDD